MAVHPHGAGTTNLIFMLPNSYVLEIFPPHFFYDCYMNMSPAFNVMYEYIISYGEIPRKCRRRMRRYKNYKCLTELRDVQYSANITEIFSKLDNAIPLVQKKKYPSIWK